MLSLKLLPILIILTLSSCNQTENTSKITWQEFCCRDLGDLITRIPLYRAKTPTHWQRQDPSVHESTFDTTKPVTEFYIGNHHDEKIYLTVFTFPVKNYDQRIPPSAQVERWKRQFDEFDATTLIVSPCARAGFTGLSISLNGLIKGEEISLLGYSMQLAPIHWFALKNGNTSFKHSQMTADYTLKALGSPSALLKWKNEISLFANSFELIEEIPTR